MAFILNDAKRVVGRISNTGANNYTIHATLEERSTDIATNTSSLYYKVWLTADNDSYVTDIDGNTKYMSGWAFDNGNITAYININGSSFASAQNSNFSMGYPGYGYSYPSSVTILEGTKSIAHNSDGTLTVAVTAGITNNNNYGATPASGSMSKTASLTTIARKSTMTATNATLGGSVTFSITSKSSSFTHKIYASCGSWNNDNQPISTGGAWTVPDLSGYFTSSETSKAVNFTLYTYNGSTTVGSDTASCTISLPGKNTSSAQSVQLGSSKNIPITKAYSSYKSTVEYTLNGGSSWTRIGDAQTTGTSVSFSPAASLGSNFPKEMSHTYTFRVTTYANSTGGYRSIGSNTYNLTLTIPDYQPSVSFTTARIKNDNSTIAGWGVAVKGYTKYEYAATSTNYYGATTASWSFSCGGRTKSGSSGTTDAFNAAGSSTPTIVVTDSRGKQNNAKASVITIYDYGAPVIVSTYAYRTDANGTKKDDGTYVTAKINAKTDYTCGGNNSITVQTRWKTSTGIWSSWSNKTNNTEFRAGDWDIATSYQYEMRVVDSLGGTKSVTYTIPTASVAFNIKEGGKGASFFGYAQKDGYLEVNANLEAIGKVFTGVGYDIPYTDDVRAEALAMQDGATKFFRAGGSSYTGDAPYKYGTFIVQRRGINTIFVTEFTGTTVHCCVYDGAKWSDWDHGVPASNPIVYGHSSAIGTTTTAEKGGQIATGTWMRNANSISLSAGTWLVISSFDFTGYNGGMRRGCVNTSTTETSGRNDNFTIFPTTASESWFQFPRIFSSSSSFTVYNHAFQSSGASLTFYGSITAVRIA